MRLTKIESSWARKLNGKNLSEDQIIALIKLKLKYPGNWRDFSILDSGPLPGPCDGCNKPPNKHPNKKCSQYWLWSGDT